MSLMTQQEQMVRCPSGMVELDATRVIPIGTGQLGGDRVGYSCVPGADEMPLLQGVSPDHNLPPSLQSALEMPHTSQYYAMDIPEQPEPPTIRREFYEGVPRFFPGERRYGLNMNVDHQPVFLMDAHLLTPNRYKRWDFGMRPEPFEPQADRGVYEQPLIAMKLPAERSYVQGIY